MRYIDADKLMLHLNDYKLQVSPSWKDEWERMVSCLVIDTCMEAVQEQPTADVRENVRGEWRTTYLDHVAMGERPKILYCSVCNQCIAYPTNYCPNCGADMREGRTEE
jgi:hypothetical protein